MSSKHARCKICGKEHALGGCPEFQSTAARKDVRQRDEGVTSPDLDRGKAQGGGLTPEKPTQAGTQALPVDTRSQAMDFLIAESPDELFPPKPKIGRPRTGFNKKEYNRQFTADLRTIKRLNLNCTVAVYRAGKYKESEK